MVQIKAHSLNTIMENDLHSIFRNNKSIIIGKLYKHTTNNMK